MRQRGLSDCHQSPWIGEGGCCETRTRSPGTLFLEQVRKKKARKGQGAGSSENEAGGGGGVATGKEAARLLAAAAAGAGECILEEVGGW